MLGVLVRSSRCIPVLALVLAVGGCHSGTPVTPNPPPAAAASPTPNPPTAAPNRPPTATISDWQPRTPAVVGGTRVGFGTKASDPDGDRLTYSWDFDDGTTDSGEALFHVFNKEGVFTVTLTVSDGRGGVATDQVQVRARSIVGDWRIENAMHIPMTASIWQNREDRSFIQGETNDHSTFEGHLLDPYGIRIEYTSRDTTCLASDVYEGGIVSSINEIVFQGTGCRKFSFVR